MMGFHTTLGTTADAGCTTSHGPMTRRLPLLHHGAVEGLAHAASIRGEPRALHPGSEQGIFEARCIPRHSAWLRTVPPVTDGSGIRRWLPRSGPGYSGPSTASVLAAVDWITGYNTMLPNSFAPAENPVPPVPTIAQYRVGFLPAVHGGVSASGEDD
jgi:hypothetical protein